MFSLNWLGKILLLTKIPLLVCNIGVKKAPFTSTNKPYVIYMNAYLQIDFPMLFVLKQELVIQCDPFTFRYRRRARISVVLILVKPFHQK